MYFAIDEFNSQIVVSIPTDNSFKDREVYEDLVDGIKKEIE